MAAVNRKVCYVLVFLPSPIEPDTTSIQDAGLKPAAGKEKEEVGLKRGRSDSISCAQRVPLGPGRAPAAPPVNARVAVARARANYATTRRNSQVTTSISQPIVVPLAEEIESVKDVPQSEMDIEDDPAEELHDETENISEREAESMTGIEQSDEDGTPEPIQASKHPRMWPEVSSERATRYTKELQAIRATFEDEVDMFDTTMVSEYAEEIFEYMCDLEVRVLLGWNQKCTHILIRKKSCLSPTICPIKLKSPGRCARR